MKVISEGNSFEPKGLSIAPKILANFLDRITQLYEQSLLGHSWPENLNFDKINAIKKVAPNEQTRVAPVGRSR